MKAGAGTLTLTGNNSYTGLTSVTGGQLSVNGAFASTLAIAPPAPCAAPAPSPPAGGGRSPRAGQFPRHAHRGRSGDAHQHLPPSRLTSTAPEPRMARAIIPASSPTGSTAPSRWPDARSGAARHHRQRQQRLQPRRWATFTYPHPDQRRPPRFLRRPQPAGERPAQFHPLRRLYSPTSLALVVTPAALRQSGGQRPGRHRQCQRSRSAVGQHPPRRRHRPHRADGRAVHQPVQPRPMGLPAALSQNERRGQCLHRRPDLR